MALMSIAQVSPHQFPRTKKDTRTAKAKHIIITTYIDTDISKKPQLPTHKQEAHIGKHFMTTIFLPL